MLSCAKNHRKESAERVVNNFNGALRFDRSHGGPGILGRLRRLKQHCSCHESTRIWTTPPEWPADKSTSWARVRHQNLLKFRGTHAERWLPWGARESRRRPTAERNRDFHNSNSKRTTLELRQGVKWSRGLAAELYRRIFGSGERVSDTCHQQVDDLPGQAPAVEPQALTAWRLRTQHTAIGRTRPSSDSERVSTMETIGRQRRLGPKTEVSGRCCERDQERKQVTTDFPPTKATALQNDRGQACSDFPLHPAQSRLHDKPYLVHVQRQARWSWSTVFEKIKRYLRVMSALWGKSLSGFIFTSSWGGTHVQRRRSISTPLDHRFNPLSASLTPVYWQAPTSRCVNLCSRRWNFFATSLCCFFSLSCRDAAIRTGAGTEVQPPISALVDPAKTEAPTSTVRVCVNLWSRQFDFFATSLRCFSLRDVDFWAQSQTLMADSTVCCEAFAFSWWPCSHRSPASRELSFSIASTWLAHESATTSPSAKGSATMSCSNNCNPSMCRSFTSDATNSSTWRRIPSRISPLAESVWHF